MISELVITDPLDTPVKHWPKVKSLKKRNTFEFGPGLNIIVGPNGSGKSTLLTLLRRSFLVEESYYSCYTYSSIKNMCKPSNPFEEEGDIAYYGYHITHDGNPVFSLDTEKSVGTKYGQLTDFVKDGISRIYDTSASSTGQSIVYQLNSLFEYVEKINEVQTKIHNHSPHEVWGTKIEAAKKIIDRPRLEKSHKTIILDEPTTNLDLQTEMQVWDILQHIAGQYQIIVSTHSIGAVRKFKCDTRIIEMKRGYLNSLRKMLKSLV